jgi:hypothetical protein
MAALRLRPRLRLYCKQFCCADNELGGLAAAGDLENALFVGSTTYSLPTFMME